MTTVTPSQFASYAAASKPPAVELGEGTRAVAVEGWASYGSVRPKPTGRVKICHVSGFVETPRELARRTQRPGDCTIQVTT